MAGPQGNTGRQGDMVCFGFITDLFCSMNNYIPKTREKENSDSDTMCVIRSSVLAE